MYFHLLEVHKALDTSTFKESFITSCREASLVLVQEKSLMQIGLPITPFLTKQQMIDH
jgi:hypothetical protein